MLGRASSAARGTTSSTSSIEGRAGSVSDARNSDSGTYKGPIKSLIINKDEEVKTQIQVDLKCTFAFLAGVVESARNFLDLLGLHRFLA